VNAPAEPFNAAATCKAVDHWRLARLCRYMARPAIALQGLSRDGNGLLVLAPKRGLATRALSRA